MNICPVETERLLMRPISATDESLFARLYTDEETMRFIGEPLSAQRAVTSFRAALAGMQHQPIERLFLTVMEKPSLRDVGICSLQNCDPQRRSVQAGVMFVPNARAQGYAKEAFVGLIQRVFAELPIDRLWVQFSDAHLAVQRGVISVGFTRDAGLEAGPQQLSVWSVCRASWVAPRESRIADDISNRKQA
jgi:ribosomal-protein-alanine N-acetyltransferase